MKYTIEDENGDTVSIYKAFDNVFLESNGDQVFEFTQEEFKEFRKAVGYVGQEVHSDGE